MKPFNLERALAGDPVVTRDGKKVTNIRYGYKPVRGQVTTTIKSEEGEEVIEHCEAFYLDGTEHNNRSSNYDLFMSSKTVYRNVIADPILGSILGASTYDTKEEAINDRRYMHFIGIAEIEEE